MRINIEETYIGEHELVVYDNEPFTGELETTDPHGTVLALETYYVGIQHGLQQYWYSDGQLQEEGIYHMGSAIGDWRKWHPNGQLAEIYSFNKNGWPLHVKRWDENGNLIADEKLS